MIMSGLWLSYNLMCVCVRESSKEEGRCVGEWGDVERDKEMLSRVLACQVRAGSES